MKNLAIALVVIILIALASLSMAYGIRKTEEIECLKLKELEKTHHDFYWTDWQVSMCSQYE